MVLLWFNLLCPRHDNGRGIKCYPCPLCIRPSVRMSKCLTQWPPLSKSNRYDQNFMKLGHIVAYHNVFFKFDNGPYRMMPSGVIALCLWKFTIWNLVRPQSEIVLIRILWNLVTLFSIYNVFFKINNGPYRIMPSRVIALCSWKFTIFYGVRSLSPVILITTLWNLFTVFNTKMSFSGLIMVYITIRVIALCWWIMTISMMLCLCFK